MYYNRFTNKLIIDAIDYFVISGYLARVVTIYLKNYLSKEAQMERLRTDLINQSKVIEPSESQVNLSNLSSRQKKLEKIYRFALNGHGGDIISDLESEIEVSNSMEYKLATAIRDNKRWSC